ncbi:hypothetical protein VST7929_01013 [Vibrio stylophorae]|uniref:VOC family protein n=1 Tax=Vibrio stylophorae TaxID=659351 RepID=A0ABM8ZS78_9VIBR|nr:hypothetical protein [Vibrio stylophorae]CAH0533152.1 hypothetical protein VST7929_01013 [Vibrio stylophorae]
MKKLHLALGSHDIEASVDDYNQRLGQSPELYIEGEYALWRTESLNLSVRRVAESESGQLRHLGWEDANATEFRQESDVNGIVWEHFHAEHQVQEILEAWPAILASWPLEPSAQCEKAVSTTSAD